VADDYVSKRCTYRTPDSYGTFPLPWQVDNYSSYLPVTASSTAQETMMKGKHPGFKKAQASIAKKQGVSKERAGAILAASSRGASAAAKKANPRLKKVK